MAQTRKPVDVEDAFTEIVHALEDTDGVAMAAGRGFGAGTLQVRGRIFAMISGGHLVLKLPSGRVADLIAAGDGLPFDAGKGRPMREWIALEDRSRDRWLDLAREARDFLGNR